MRRISIAIVVTMLMFTTSCELTSPEQVRNDIVDGLRPYFPNAKALVQDDVIVGLSCIDSAGPALVQKVQEILPTLSQFKKLQMGRSFRLTKYRYLGIGFPDSMVRYDVDAGTLETVHPGANYEQSYRALCGTYPVQLAYIGVWELELENPDGSTFTDKWIDTLGAYPNEREFQNHEIAELDARERVIRASVEQRGQKLVGMKLLGFSSAPITQGQLSEFAN